MRLTRVVVAGLAAVLIAAGGYGWYVANDEPQHRARPSGQPAPQQAQPAPQQAQPASPRAQPRTPPQAGHRAPDTAAPEHAKPRADGDQPHASTRPPGDRPGRPIVIIPYPGGFGPWWGYPYGYPYGYPPQPPWWAISDWARADIRLDVSPKDASVYVDGYYVGPVDDFDGIFQHLTVTSGPHHIDIRKPEYVTLAFDVNLEPGQTITYKRTMEPKTGENLEFAP
jgi:hypothetical protein